MLLQIPVSSVLAIDWEGFLSGETGFSMFAIYVGCATLGGAILTLQLFMLLFGFGDVDEFDFDADVDMDGGGDGAGYLSIRALAGFFTFFGLAGMQGMNSGWHPALTIGVATAAGLAMLFMIAWLMSLYRKLDEKGNVDPSRAVGKTAKVYLRIPPKREGKGKVTVLIQGRELQFEAVTAGEELSTGSECRLLKMTTQNTFEVEPLHAAT